MGHYIGRLLMAPVVIVICFAGWAAQGVLRRIRK